MGDPRSAFLRLPEAFSCSPNFATTNFATVPRDTGTTTSSMAEAEAEADSRPVEGRIISKLQAVFSPKHLEVLNESASHNVPRGSETHFKVIVVSDGFAGVGPLDRHRLVNGALADELAGCVRFAITPTVPTHRALVPQQGASRLAPSSLVSQGCARAINRGQDSDAVG